LSYIPTHYRLRNYVAPTWPLSAREWQPSYRSTVNPPPRTRTIVATAGWRFKGYRENEVDPDCPRVSLLNRELWFGPRSRRDHRRSPRRPSDGADRHDPDRVGVDPRRAGPGHGPLAGDGLRRRPRRPGSGRLRACRDPGRPRASPSRPGGHTPASGRPGREKGTTGRAGPRGSRRRVEGKAPRTTVTVAGRLTLMRRSRRCPGCGLTSYPLDLRVGLDGSLNPRAIRIACLASASWSFDITSDRFDEIAGLRVDDETIRRHCLKAAADLAARPKAAFAATRGDVEFLIDGVMAPTRDGWREVKMGRFQVRPAGEAAQAHRPGRILRATPRGPLDRQRGGGGAGPTDGPAAEGAGPGLVHREHRRDGLADRDGRYPGLAGPVGQARRMISGFELLQPPADGVNQTCSEASPNS